MEEDPMSEYTLSCEHFLATTRQHFFSSDLAATFPQALADEDYADSCGETEQRAHAGV
jgi:hypothetical protein